ncbi:unnamed protein product [Anisakis simplex]|uniref:Peptidase_M23 domain-containing protein n=1 Tax=Anisakis simplex TaxID=6269 RepID=A0A0M3KBV1_ANISI|nr:unnamed protein product [Anisakis simplex]
MAPICEGNTQNKLIDCDGGFCGYYKSQRANGELVEGVDVECSPQSDVFAPFDGELYFWRPFGNRADHQCADEGVRIEGTGQWQGYHVHISSIALDLYGGKVRKGEKIGTAKDRRCVDGIDGDPYLRFQLYNKGRAIDPTYHLQECMCTGQICESNRHNHLLGPPFKHDSRYNGVRGWDIKCPMVSDEGTSGARYRDKVIGRQRVVQGEPIATRLDCENSPDSIFMEVRYRGDVVNISDMISGSSCKKPDFPPH